MKLPSYILILFFPSGAGGECPAAKKTLAESAGLLLNTYGRGCQLFMPVAVFHSLGIRDPGGVMATQNKDCPLSLVARSSSMAFRIRDLVHGP